MVAIVWLFNSGLANAVGFSLWQPAAKISMATTQREIIDFMTEVLLPKGASKPPALIQAIAHLTLEIAQRKQRRVLTSAVSVDRYPVLFAVRKRRGMKMPAKRVRKISLRTKSSRFGNPGNGLVGFDK